MKKNNKARKDYLTWDEWTEANWLSNYKNSFFKINVSTDIQSGELFSKM